MPNKYINTEEKEAVKAILTYSNTAVELLRRKKMKRDILFQYLTECDVFVQVVADKKEIMNLVLSHWGSPEAVKAILTYSNTAVELLRRKKMKRGILFQYLTECDVFVQVVADKKEIMNLVLSHWGSPEAVKAILTYTNTAVELMGRKKMKLMGRKKMKLRLTVVLSSWGRNVL